MKYFLDTEFLEGGQNKTLFGGNYGKTKPTIDLISIGIVAEDGREYYAISKDFNLKEAWNRFQWKETTPAKKYLGFFKEKEYWIKDNVLKPIFFDLNKEEYGNAFIPSKNTDFTYKNMQKLINKYGKTNEEITKEICYFIDARWVDKGKPEKGYIYPCNGSCGGNHIHTSNVEFYAYYADYDWVAFCWLFGKMIDLPKGFPKYCRDLKQILDDKEREYNKTVSSNLKFNPNNILLKKHINYPKQTNEHNALDDARWNYELYKFLKNMWI